MSTTETQFPPTPTLPPRSRKPASPPAAMSPDANHQTTDMSEAQSQGGANHGEHHEDDWGQVARPRKGNVILIAVVVAVLLAIVFLTGFIPRHHQQTELNAQASDAVNGPIAVDTFHPTRAPAVVNISVPGSLRPWQEVSVFARTSGYLKKWYADISNQVKVGQVLAEIDSPTVDQDLKAAQAALGQATANLEKAKSDAELQKVTLKRYQDLTKSQSITQQQLDQQQSTYDVAVANQHAFEATVTSDQANVAKLEQMQSYEKVTAPFAGVITGRPYDTGSLITADPTDINVKPMYKIAENDVLRVFVNVPQSDALSITKGMDVQVVAREIPDHVFIGKVMGTTNYLDATTRSLLTEIKVPNDNGDLLPGMYVMANFTLNRVQPPLMVKAPALVINGDGNQVAIVKDGKVHFQHVTMGRDFGSTVEITQGLQGDEQIISNPNEQIVEGVAVDAKDPGANAAAPPAQRTASAK